MYFVLYWAPVCGKVLCCVFCGVDGVVHMDRLILVLPKMRTRRAIIQVNHLYHIISYHIYSGIFQCVYVEPDNLLIVCMWD